MTTLAAIIGYAVLSIWALSLAWAIAAYCWEQHRQYEAARRKVQQIARDLAEYDATQTILERARETADLLDVERVLTEEECDEIDRMVGLK
jgi:uncharacterized protein YutE (UPF0331/DUF86 family)